MYKLCKFMKSIKSWETKLHFCIQQIYFELHFQCLFESFLYLRPRNLNVTYQLHIESLILCVYLNTKKKIKYNIQKKVCPYTPYTYAVSHIYYIYGFTVSIKKARNISTNIIKTKISYQTFKIPLIAI